MKNVLSGLPPRRALQRAKSAIAVKDRSKGPNGSAEEDWELRHGWDAQYSSDDYLKLLTSVRRELRDHAAFHTSNNG